MLHRQSLLDNSMYAAKNIAYGLAVLTASVGLLALVLQGLVFTASRGGQSQLDQQVAAYTKLKTEIEGKNKLYATLGEIQGSRVVWSDYLTEFFQTLPPGLVIEKLSGEYSERNPRLTFSGSAVNRNTLIVLQERLQGLEWVGGIDAPHSNLIDRVNPLYIFYVDINTDAKEEQS